MKQFYIIILYSFLLISSIHLSAKNNDGHFNIKNEFAPPTATITGNATVCQNATSPVITFTGSGGTAPFTFIYTITGVAGNQIITTTSGNSVTILASTANTGSFVYTLVSIAEGSNTPIAVTGQSATIVVNALPSVDFTFTNNTCSGTAVQFTSSVSGNPPFTYLWDFGGSGNTSTNPNPIYVFNNTNGNTTQSFNVTLTVTNANGCVSKITKVVTIQNPDTTLSSSATSDIYNGFKIFKVCTNDVSIIDFINASTTNSTNTNYVINWGDSTPDFSSTTFTSTSHTYSVGLWTLTYKVTGQNGCSISRIYKVFVGNNPAVGIGNPGNTNICITTPLTFPITGTENNPPGTIYTITFNDGSNPTLFNHPPPASITHTFLKSSCGVTSGSQLNSFSATIEASNPCDVSLGTVVPIRVSTPPKANFTEPQPIICTNTQICLTDSSTRGFTATNSTCLSPKLVWIISPATGFILSSGTLGSDNNGSTNTNTWTSGTNSICPVFSVSGTYSITLKTGNSCDSDQITKTICIEPPLTPQFTLNPNSGCAPIAITTNNTTVASNSCTTPTYVWNVTHTPAYCGNSITSIPNQTTTNASYNFTEPGTYTIKLTATNSCGSFSSSQTVIVKKPPTVTINTIANVCQAGNSTAINPTATVPVCANATYAWSFPGGSSSNSTSPTPTVTYNAAGTYDVNLSVTNECGTTVATKQTFTVFSSPTITGTLFSCVGFTSQLTGSATAAITNPWTSSSPAIATVSSTGLVTGLSGGTTTITYTNSNNCKTTALFTVNPAPTITQPASSAVCLGGNPTVLSVTISGATGTPTYQWYSNVANNTISGTAIPGEINTTYTPPSTTAGTLFYYCIITLPTGGCSSIKTNTAAVTIIPNATIITQPTLTQNLCVGATIPNPLTITYSGGTGTATYQWYSNTTNSNTGGTPITGANSASYSPLAFLVPNNYYYYATVSLNGNGCLPATSNVAEIIVYPDPTISSQPIASQTLCQTATPLNLDVIATGGNGTFSYQWYSNSTNLTTGGTLIIGATNSIYSPPTSAIGTLYYYCVVSQNGTSGCSVTSATAAIIVISSPTITQPTSSTICSGGTPAPLSISVNGATGTPQYQWYFNVANNNTTGILIPGETNATFNPPNSIVGTIYYYCIVTLPSGGCSSITSNTASVVITAGATISTQPTPTQSLCLGVTLSSPLTIAYLGGTGTPTYQWYSNTTNSNTGGTIISGATSTTFTPPVFVTTGNYYYYAVITLSGNGCGPISSNPAEVVIVADPVVSLQPLSSQAICQNAPASDLVVVASGGIGTTYSYQWFSNTNNNTTSGTAISGAISATYSPPTSTVGTVYYYCVITQSAGSGCNVTSNTASVIVNLAPTFTSQPTSSIICVGQTPTLLSVSYINGVGLPKYQWYSNITNDTINGIQISGATNPTYNPQNLITGTIYYYCIITLPTGGCSNLTSNTATVTVNPNPVISNKSTIICSGKSFKVIPDSLSGDIVPMGTTYTWTNPTISPAGSITGASAQSIPQNNISQTLINNNTSPAIVTYNVTPVSGACTGINFTIVVTVNPSISSNVTSTNSTCFAANNGTIQTSITGGIPFSSGASYLISWTGPNGFTSSAPSLVNLDPGNYNLSITDAGGCPINETYTITEPADILIVTDLEKDITCFNAANGAIQITVTGGTPAYNYSWTKNGITFSRVEDLSGLSPGVYEVTVSDTNSCGQKKATFTITEPQVLDVTLVNQTNILCFGASTGVINVNVVGGTRPLGYNFAWTGPNGFTSTNQNLTDILAGTYNLTVTDNLGCTDALTVILTQPKEVVVTAQTTPIICYGDNNASITLTITGGISPYTVLWSNLASGTFQDNLSAGDYLITVTDALNCVKTLNVNIPEAPIFSVNPVVKNISCFGANNGSINLNLIGGIAPIKLTWSDGSVAGTTRNNLKPGTYSVTIIDSKPCTINRTFVILEPQLLVLSANLTNAFDCDNANSGAINLLVSGGSAPFTYAWSNGAITEDLNNIPAGNYLVTVTDFNGCSKQAQYSIKRPPLIAPSVITKTDFDCETKYVKQSFVADVSGGVPPYQLLWSSGTLSGANNEIMSTNQNGIVVLNVIDAIGCKSNYTFTVDIPTLGSPLFNVSSYAYSTYGTYSINDPIQFTNTATGDYISVVWDFGDGTFSTELNPSHTFINSKEYVVTQTVTYPFGCVYVNKITFIVGKGYFLVVPTAFTPNSDTLNDTFRPITKALKNVHLDVYDTWGSMIYSESGDILRGWDGKIKGINAENGNYYCKVSGETFYGAIVNESHPFVLIK